jgi:hypothetical protein
MEGVCEHRERQCAQQLLCVIGVKRPALHYRESKKTHSVNKWRLSVLFFCATTKFEKLRVLIALFGLKRRISQGLSV